MKQYLDKQQTAKLIELGYFRPALTWKPPFGGRDDIIYNPFSIGELLSFLPENIAKENEMPSTLNISLMNGEWCVEYADFLGADFSFSSVELIDAIFDMIVKLKKATITTDTEMDYFKMLGLW